MKTQEVTEKIRDISNDLRKDFTDDKKSKALMAFQRFNEYLLRVKNRHDELLHIESFKTNTDPIELEKYGITVHDTQLLFVDKTEAFHQQVYACISAFILLLSYVAKQEFISQMPISRVTRFLNFISAKQYDNAINNQATILLGSVNFRSKFIDHPQQHALHDWMTISYITGTCIVYFIKIGNEVYHRENMDPYSSDFEPPVNYQTFYVSPKHTETFEAVKDFSVKVLEVIQKESAKK